jgi:Nif-specific regulatory protein
MKDSTLHQARTLAALTDISRHISSSLDYRQIAYDCLIALSENLDLERCTLLMPAADRKSLCIHVGIDWTEEEAESIGLDIPGSIPGQVLVSGMPVAVQDVKDIPSLFVPDIKNEDSGVTGFIAVPVQINRESIGILMAYRVSNRTMLDEDVNVMKIVASILSQTLKLADYVESAKQKLKEENAELHAELGRHFNIENIISSSSAMDTALGMVRKVAYTDATVLLRGESGTGKTLIAKGLHYTSQRRQSPLIVVSCASIPENLIESELFGHEKGAFTGAVNKRIGKFEAAEGGTIILDEIGELSMDTQAKVLRIIQEGVFERLGSNITKASNVRLICATNADLEKKIAEKKFREDLYYRLMVVPIYIPALRDRREDILPLTFHFLSEYNRKYGKQITLSCEALDFLEEYSWPGNVRELEHTIERTIILAGDNQAPVMELPILKPLSNIYTGNGEKAVRPAASNAIIKERALYERVPLREGQVRAVLEESSGIQTLAARKLGVSLRQFRYAIKKYGIDAKSFKY